MARAGIWLGGLAVFGALSSVWLWSRVPPRLRDLATRTVAFPLPAGTSGAQHRFTPDGSLRLLLWTHANSRSSASGPRVLAIDCRSGAKLWERKFGGVDGPYSFSPDGKWLLYWIGELGGQGPRKIVATDGTSRQFTPAARMRWATSGIWKGQSGEWIEVDEMDGSEAAVYSVTTSAPAVHTLPKSIMTQPLWIDSSDRLVVSRFRRNAGEDTHVAVDEIRLSAAPNVRRLPIQLPSEVDFIQAALSPDERRVAWTLYCRDSRPAWLRRVLQLLGERLSPETSAGLWISRNDGSEMRQLCRITAGDGIAGDVVWNRDSSAVTFLGAGGLYSIPIHP